MSKKLGRPLSPEKSVKMNFSLPPALAQFLQKLGNRSAFVSAAIQEKIDRDSENITITVDAMPRGNIDEKRFNLTIEAKKNFDQMDTWSGTITGKPRDIDRFLNALKNR